MPDDITLEKQLRLENLRRALKDLDREELEEMFMETTTALVQLTEKVQFYCQENGII